jgi:hypothetical protein
MSFLVASPMPLTTNSYHKRLTAIELMTFDDIVTDALVDCVSLQY